MAEVGSKIANLALRILHYIGEFGIGAVAPRCVRLALAIYAHPVSICDLKRAVWDSDRLDIFSPHYIAGLNRETRTRRPAPGKLGRWTFTLGYSGN